MAGPFNDQLGLTRSIKQELHSAGKPTGIPKALNAAAQSALESNQLDLLTTSELMASLQSQQGPWILGLSRVCPKGHSFEFEAFYRGDRATCAGLADRLGWDIARSAIAHRLSQAGLSARPEHVAMDLIRTVQTQVRDGTPWVGFTSGLPILLEHALRATMNVTQTALCLNDCTWTMLNELPRIRRIRGGRLGQPVKHGNACRPASPAQTPPGTP